MSCIPQSDFAVVVAQVTPSENIKSVKVYFRSLLYSDFYYVEMKPLENSFVGVLPQPSEETHAIGYYIEVVDDAFDSTRTAELTAPVREPCSERKKVAAYLGGKNPGIVVGATTNAASALPPGFKAIGIVGTITAAGAAASVGGGLGAGTVVVAAAAAAGAGGAVVLATGGSDPTTSTSTSTTSSTAAGGGSPPATSTGTSSIPSSPTTTIGSSTTSSISSAPTSTISPDSSTTTSSSASSTSTSSVPASSTTTSAVPPPVACFRVTQVGLCGLRLDATCSTGAIDDYQWQLDTGGALDGPVSDSGSVVTHSYAPLICIGARVTNVLTVRGPGGQNSLTQVYRFLLQRTDASLSKSALESSFVVADTGSNVTGTVAIDANATRTFGPSGPVSIPFQGSAGRNDVVATWMPRFPSTGTWAFDFTRTEHFVAGSIVSEEGEVLLVEPRRIVFRMNGAVPTPIRFRFDLVANR